MSIVTSSAGNRVWSMMRMRLSSQSMVRTSHTLITCSPMDPAAAVVTACRSLAAAGLVRGTSGNVSIRQGELIFASPTGVPYQELESAMVSVVRLSDGNLGSGLVPTSELPLHLAVYRGRPDVNAIVHTHSMFATVFASRQQSVPPVHYLLARAGGPPPVAPYARYGSAELAENCAKTLGDSRSVLLANHGLVCTGATLAEAMAAAEAIEYVAELAWRAMQSGAPVLLTDEQLAEAAQAFDGYGQPAN
jgi:L-fuculose-phosphate aldolase